MELTNFFKKILARTGVIKTADSPIGKYRIHQRSKATDSVIGDFTYISSDTHIQSADIGKFCSIGPNSVIGYGEHPVNYLSTSPVFYHTGIIFGKTFASEEKFDGNKRVSIGNDVWIGANVFIKSGIRIGDGSVVAAGAVVVKDVLAYTIVGGVPAGVIKQRFPTDVVESLLKIKWWNWNNEELEKRQRFFISDDLNLIREFIREHHAD
ncbi:MAG: CatB-related O-acetyltransferase [Bacteroidota bacterium]